MIGPGPWKSQGEGLGQRKHLLLWVTCCWKKSPNALASWSRGLTLTRWSLIGIIVQPGSYLKTSWLEPPTWRRGRTVAGTWCRDFGWQGVSWEAATCTQSQRELRPCDGGVYPNKGGNSLIFLERARSTPWPALSDVATTFEGSGNKMEWCPGKAATRGDRGCYWERTWGGTSVMD